ncbi:sugar phosphate isomerase/epimerase, partial [Candidatus Bipolaricaulota bacterium]|nr:sugar phosphate isomerase/epimerase [Candidatus Bipolaricaulota bacterium]
GICIDIGHAHLSQDAGRQPIENYLKRYREQLIHLHLHDNSGKQDNHRLLGKGSVDWEKLFDVLEAIRYNGPAVLEIHSEGKPLEAIVQGCEFVEGLCQTTERTRTH